MVKFVYSFKKIKISSNFNLYKFDNNYWKYNFIFLCEYSFLMKHDLKLEI